MINIVTPQTVIARDIHVNSLKDIISKRINRSSLPNYLKDLITINIPLILGGEPNVILDFNTEVYKKIKRSNNRFFDKYFKGVFNYKEFIKKDSGYNAYSLAENIRIDACSYCNRQYTITVKNKKQLTRPQFDHFFPKSVYPILGLSFYNLIPCCTICNSTFKRDDEMSLEDFFHPYDHAIANDFEFNYVLKQGNPRRCHEIKLDYLSPKNKDKVERSLNMFKIKETYDGHLFIVDNLLKVKDSLSEDYLAVLTDPKIFKGMTWSIEEAYEFAFGTSIEEKEFYKHPFSKLKKDILKKEINLGTLKK